MPGHERDGRLARGGPRLPHSVEGLVEALRALDEQDSRPLEAWDRERLPILRRAVRAWARDAVLADRLARRIVREAFSALRAGREVRSELSRMAAAAQREQPRRHPVAPPVTDGPAGKERQHG